jgi:SAM-dependent methyltransferase
MEVYNSEFYADMQISSLASAKEIIPLLISRYKPASVVDVGCGTGAFAREFIQNGVDDVTGYEGEWMRGVQTLLQQEKYIFVDFTNGIVPTRIYDLCICLEVAEHLDSSSARTLVSILTSLSEKVVFSAAIPSQGGNHHVNEQWPDFWARLFAEKGYILEWDPRLSNWNNSNIASCYRQNLLVFEKGINRQMIVPISLVHPEAWIMAMKYRKTPIWLKALHLLPRPLLRFGKKLMRRIVGQAR